MYDPAEISPPPPPWETLPTMYDLPSEEVGEPGLPDDFHRLQGNLLSDTCEPINIPSDKRFTACDLNLYYDPRNPLWYKRPDWYLVLDVGPTTKENDIRLSYVIWQEGVRPFLVVELLSPGTEGEDLGTKLRDASKPPSKWQVYEQILAVPYYVVYDRYEHNFRAFRLNGTRYEAIDLSSGRLWFEELQLGLGLWEGSYKGILTLWLRWYDANGWIPTDSERAQAAQEEVQQERDRASAAEEEAQQQRQRAEKLAEFLRSQGIDPDAIS